MAKKINHLVRRHRWFREGVETWCGKIVEKAAPFWFATTCPTCRKVKHNAKEAKAA